MPISGNGYMMQTPPPQTNKWVVALTVILPTFLEVMDTSVVNVSLPHMQGSLSAGVDEVTWVLTSYLVANAIIIPITGWLAGIFGRKRYLIFSIALFTASSLACGAAPSLEFLVLARVLQGLGGGGLQPLSQAILLETFPPKEHGMAMAVFGMGVVLAPILGPVVGGWITDNWTWRWVFYINLPVGLIAVALAALLIHDPPYIRRAKIHIDSWGLFLITVGLGCLQIVLDKGEREDWFASGFILTMSIIAAAALILFVIVELRVEHPVVNLRVFKDATFAAGNMMMFMGFFCLFGSFVLLPLYAQTLMGYTAMWAGLVLGPGGLASLFIMPIGGALMKKGVRPRRLLALGLATMAYALWLMSGLNLGAGFSAISLPRFIQGFGLGLFFVPLAASTYVNIPREEMGNASGIFNLLRNLGGSFGVATATTLLSQRSQLHQTFLVERITPYSSALREYGQQLQQLFPGQDPLAAKSPMVLAGVYREVLRQANMLAFNDVFWLFAWLTAILVPLTVFMKRAKGTAVPARVGEGH
jgi:MFS transporter, DHA2 family, multidrug resistance protein